MRLHVLSLPHTQTTAAYASCAYTQKVRKFCKGMVERGYEVILYSGEENDAVCTEHVPCVFKNELKHLAEGHYTSAPFDVNAPLWRIFNKRATDMIREVIQDKDFICVIGGVCHKPVADAFPAHMTVEFGIGYGGTFSKFRVFESYAWMHAVYGEQQGAMSANGNFYDAVIPNMFEVADFPYGGEEPGDYFLYLGRLIPRKGVHIAEAACMKIGAPLKIAGFGDHKPTYGELVGEVGIEERGRLLSKARAVFVPTLYVEPFGGVAVEAMMCGTPVITTDWGAFTETVENGKNGYRCRTLDDFCTAAKEVDHLYRRDIRNAAHFKYSVPYVARQYDEYFTRLMTLWDKGWYT
jgi:glycosyltransferase involved in cell wall biosynthesis